MLGNWQNILILEIAFKHQICEVAQTARNDLEVKNKSKNFDHTTNFTHRSCPSRKYLDLNAHDEAKYMGNKSIC